MSNYNTFTLPVQPLQPVPQAAPVASIHYASFGKRLAAYVIDWMVIGAAEAAILLVTGLVIAGSAMTEFGDPGATAIGMIFLVLPILLPLAWLYFTLQESSIAGATIGKRAMGLRVTDMNGNRITFARATGRYFGRLLSHMLCMFGYIMAAFTDKRQALHDMVAGTLVLDVSESSYGVPSGVAQRAVTW